MYKKYIPKGVCSRQIDIEVEGDIVKNVEFHGGCNGNAKGIGALVRGMKIDDVIEKLAGTTCGFRSTSCPNELAKALEEIKGK